MGVDRPRPLRRGRPLRRAGYPCAAVPAADGRGHVHRQRRRAGLHTRLDLLGWVWDAGWVGHYLVSGDSGDPWESCKEY